MHVAIILAQLETEIDVIIAGMFCDVAKKGKLSLNEINARLADDIVLLIKETQEADFETASDNVFLIKLAERLHNMRTIDFMSDDKVKEKAEQTMELVMPIARKVGNSKLVNELDDLVLQYSH